jgi:mono/diheme cytochrome c family protein
MIRFLKSAALIGLAAACAREPAPDAPAQPEAAYRASEAEQKLAAPPATLAVDWPEPNARRGRIMFVTRACVICHEVNGVGGKAAPSLNAPPSRTHFNPLEFSARMWRGAQAMAALQSIELGYVIDLDGEDIADLAAFASSPEEQKLLTIESVPAPLRDWFIDERYWEQEDWADYFKRGSRLPGLGEEETP